MTDAIDIQGLETPEMGSKSAGPDVKNDYADRQFFQISPFLSSLIGEGAWHEHDPENPEEGSYYQDNRHLIPSIQEFRRRFPKLLVDPEAALLALRRLRVRTLLALGRADLENRIKPHQIRARLKLLAETMIQGAWWLAETSLREKYVHPVILERRNINPPLAIFSLSRLGAGEPWYTTGPAPVFVHTRAAEFAPALTEKDFAVARRSKKTWLPARDYFHRLARRIMSYLSLPDPAGRGFDHMAEDLSDQRPLLPGALVVLFSSFQEHFISHRPVRERLALIRLRFLVGQERLGRAVETAARSALLKTASELGSRLKIGLNGWYKERAAAEGLPLVKGSLLDIERVIRLIQFKWAQDDQALLDPSPLKALDLLVRAEAILPDERLILSKSYSWQWFVFNRLSLLGRRTVFGWEDLRAGRLDDLLGLPGAAERTMKMIRAAQDALSDLLRESRSESSSGLDLQV